MPRERESMRTSASQVKSARENLSAKEGAGRGTTSRFGGMRAPSSPSSSSSSPSQSHFHGTAASVTASARARTIDKDGDDAIFAGAETFSSSSSSSSYEGRGGGRRGGYGGGRFSSSSASDPSAGGSSSGVSGRKTPGGAAYVPRGAVPQGGRPMAGSPSRKPAASATGTGAAEEEDYLNRPADLTGSGLVGIGGNVPDGLSVAKAARLAELDRLAEMEEGGAAGGAEEGESGAAGGAGGAGKRGAGHRSSSSSSSSSMAAAAGGAATATSGRRGLAEGEEADANEERLIDELELNFGDEAGEVLAEADESTRLQLLEAHRAAQELSAERGMVDDLPELDPRKSDVFTDQKDPALRRLIESDMPRLFSPEELLDADHRDYILSPDSVITPSELEGEQIEMETQFSFGPQANEISLHSEKGLLYGVVDMFDRMVTEKKRHLLVKAKQQKRFEIWRAISWKMREKKMKIRRERQIKARNAARELFFKNQQDPEMVFYPDMNLWFSKTELKNDVLRNAVSAAVSNPTWGRNQRRNFLKDVKQKIALLGEPVPTKVQQHIDTIFNMPKDAPVTDLRTVEHMLTLPITDWSLLMAQAERAMDPADRARRFDPSPIEKSGSKL